MGSILSEVCKVLKIFFSRVVPVLRILLLTAVLTITVISTIITDSTSVFICTIPRQ